jgi:hypothetical protein
LKTKEKKISEKKPDEKPASIEKDENQDTKKKVK